MEISLNGKLRGHLERAWRLEHPDEALAFDMWCVAVLANAAAKILQQATVREVFDALKDENEPEEKVESVPLN